MKYFYKHVLLAAILLGFICLQISGTYAAEQGQSITKPISIPPCNELKNLFNATYRGYDLQSENFYKILPNLNFGKSFESWTKDDFGLLESAYNNCYKAEPTFLAAKHKGYEAQTIKDFVRAIFLHREATKVLVTTKNLSSNALALSGDKVEFLTDAEIQKFEQFYKEFARLEREANSSSFFPPTIKLDISTANRNFQNQINILKKLQPEVAQFIAFKTETEVLTAKAFNKMATDGEISRLQSLKSEVQNKWKRYPYYENFTKRINSLIADIDRALAFNTKDLANQSLKVGSPQKIQGQSVSAGDQNEAAKPERQNIANTIENKQETKKEDDGIQKHNEKFKTTILISIQIVLIFILLIFIFASRRKFHSLAPILKHAYEIKKFPPFLLLIKYIKKSKATFFVLSFFAIAILTFTLMITWIGPIVVPVAALLIAVVFFPQLRKTLTHAILGTLLSAVGLGGLFKIWEKSRGSDDEQGSQIKNETTSRPIKIVPMSQRGDINRSWIYDGEKLVPMSQRGDITRSWIYDGQKLVPMSQRGDINRSWIYDCEKIVPMSLRNDINRSWVYGGGETGAYVAERGYQPVLGLRWGKTGPHVTARRHQPILGY